MKPIKAINDLFKINRRLFKKKRICLLNISYSFRIFLKFHIALNALLLTQNPTLANKIHMSYDCTPRGDDFVLFRVKDEDSLTNFDKSALPVRGSPIHLNINQFDGKLFDFYSDVGEFSGEKAKGWIAFGWGTNSFDHGIYYEINPQYWKCQLEHNDHD